MSEVADSCVYATSVVVCQLYLDKLPTYQLNSKVNELRRVLVRMGDVYKRSGSYGYMCMHSTGLQQTLLCSAMRSVDEKHYFASKNQNLRVFSF